MSYTCAVDRCIGEDKRVSTKCVDCGRDITVTVGHHSGVSERSVKDAYTCIRCRGR